MVRRHRLEVENAELANSFRAADLCEQARVAEQMVRRAIAVQARRSNYLRMRRSFEALVSELDASEDEGDFRHARAASAAAYLRGKACAEALYEALHAHQGDTDAVAEALNFLR